ncbi:MAG: protein kinase [Chlamydiota bacterium]
MGQIGKEYTEVAIMPFYNKGTLLDFIGNKDNSKELLPIFQKTIEALEKLHELGYVHRDLKPENIFCHKEEENENLKIGLGDFGCALKAGNKETWRNRFEGSFKYASPETLALEDHVSQPRDIYAFGLMLFEAFCSSESRKKFDQYAILAAKKIVNNADKEKKVSAEKYWVSVQNCIKEDQKLKNSELKTLILECTLRNPKNRPIAAQVKKKLPQILKGIE